MVEVEVLRKVVPERRERHGRVLGLPPARGEQMVDGDSVDPRRDPRFAAESAQARGDLDEDLLSRVFGVLRMPEHPLREARDVVGHEPQQRFERVPVAADGGGDQALRYVYRGHALSRWALRTVNSRASSAACASNTSSGRSGVWCMEKMYSVPFPCGTTRVCAGTSTPGSGSKT